MSGSCTRRAAGAPGCRIASAFPYGLLLAPVAHVASLPELDDAGRDGLAAASSMHSARLDRLFGAPFPYMLWIHPGVHLHVHVAPPGAQRRHAALHRSRARWEAAR